MNLDLQLFKNDLNPNISKTEQISEDIKSDHNVMIKFFQLQSIVHSRINDVSSQTKNQLTQQLQNLIQIDPDHQKSLSFEQKLTHFLHEAYHEKFKYFISITRKNYHKFMITTDISNCSYQTKVFLLQVFKQYDHLLYTQQRNTNFIKEPAFEKQYPWIEAETLTDSLQIKNFQIKMYQIYKGEFLDIVEGISPEKINRKKYLKKSSLKRGFSQSDQDSEGKKSKSSCQCKKKRKMNAEPTINNDDLEKQRVEVNVFS